MFYFPVGEKNCRLQGDDVVLHQLKIAAAIAVLRRKPPEADAYRYTKQLCTKYLQAQTQWRSRYLQAQDALLHLKQQQAISMTQPEGIPCPPTPPSSSTPPDTVSCGQCVLTVTSHQALVSSSQFIHAVVSLARAVGTEPVVPTTDTDGTTGDVRHPSPSELLAKVDTLLTETVPSCVKHLREVVCRGDTEVSTSCVMQGLDGLILLLDTDCMGSVSGGYHERLLLKQLGSLVDDLLQRLFESENHYSIQCVRTRQLLHQMLLQLTTGMRVPEKYSLLHPIATHAKTLCASLSHDSHEGKAINANCYESLAIAMDCLQQGVASVKVGDIHIESLKELQQEMEGVLESHLIYRFPLIANSVLRLTSMIELCVKSDS